MESHTGKHYLGGRENYPAANFFYLLSNFFYLLSSFFCRLCNFREKQASETLFGL